MSETALETKTSEEEGVDIFSSIAYEVENLTAEAAITALMEVVDEEGMTDFKLGGILASIQGNKLWKDMGEYESFKHFIIEQTGMEYRKSTYLIGIYHSLIESEIMYESVQHIGWSKLKDIAPILTKENAAEWIAKAESHTVIQLQALLKQAKAGLLEATEQPHEITALSSIAFKVYEDQKETIKLAVAKARAEADTDFDAVALEAICMNYLTGAKVKPISLLDVMTKFGLHEVIEGIDALWPDVDVHMSVPSGMTMQPAAQPVEMEL